MSLAGCFSLMPMFGAETFAMSSRSSASHPYGFTRREATIDRETGPSVVLRSINEKIAPPTKHPLSDRNSDRLTTIVTADDDGI